MKRPYILIHIILQVELILVERPNISNALHAMY